jgi:hypothetical protein
VSGSAANPSVAAARRGDERRLHFSVTVERAIECPLEAVLSPAAASHRPVLEASRRSATLEPTMHDSCIPLRDEAIHGHGSIGLQCCTVHMPHAARSTVVNAGSSPDPFDEEYSANARGSPAAGASARWIGASSWLCTASRMEVGKGADSARLRLDELAANGAKRQQGQRGVTEGQLGEP